MKLYLTLVALLLVFSLSAQNHFGNTYMEWPTPISGLASGYNFTSGVTTANGGQNWVLHDIDGDNLPDLVITSYKASSGIAQFDYDVNPHWKVYRNTGNGFDTSAITWTTPYGGTPSGFTLTENTANDQPDYNQSWKLKDMNGDKKDDLVIMAEKRGKLVWQFTANNKGYWNVHFNTGNGFNDTAVTWTTPGNGAYATGGGVYSVGYYDIVNDAAVASQYVYSESWGMADLNGDNMPDLIIPATKDINGKTVQYGAGNNPYWKLYLNTGLGFSDTFSQWYTPGGGAVINNVPVGYRLIANDAYSQSTLSETWHLRDIDGDNKVDLVVPAEKGDSSLYPVQFNAGNNSYWKVYLNNGYGFGQLQTWNTPIGGAIIQNTPLGYYNVTNDAFKQNNNSETWTLKDINGDGKPDLIATGQVVQSLNIPRQFNVGNNPYWKVYLNTGSTFSFGAVTWGTPVGGLIRGGENCAFNSIEYSGVNQTEPGQNWTIADMNGDNRPDLVVTAQSEGITLTTPIQFGVGTTPYWRVYINGDVTSVNDMLPKGSLGIYPNPSAGDVTITLPADLWQTGNVQLSVYNSMGQIVKREQLTTPVSQIQTAIYATGSGIYTVLLQCGDKKYTGRVVVE